MDLKFLFAITLLFSLSTISPAEILPVKINPDVIKPAISNHASDTLISGKNYTFGTRQKKQYTGTFMGSDSVYYMINTEDGIKNLKIDDVIIYKEQIAEKTHIVTSRDTLVTVELKDGNDITGFIISSDSLTITLKTKSGVTIILPRDRIEQINRPKIEYVDGEFYIIDPNDARLFLGPTARPIRKNSLFFSDVELFFTMAGFGIADVVSVVGGVSIIPFSDQQLIYINTKVTPLHTKYADLAAGFIYMNGTSSHSEGLKIGYLGGTFGTKRASFTTGLGVSFQKGSNAASTMIIIGGEARASNNVKFLLENWIFTYKDTPSLTFGGIRVFGSALAADFALMKIWDKYASNASWPFFPYVSITYNLSVK